MFRILTWVKWNPNETKQKAKKEKKKRKGCVSCLVQDEISFSFERRKNFG